MTQVTMKHNNNNTVLVTATGVTQPITAIANVVLHLEGLNGVTMAFPLEVMVHPDLSHDFLLGRDFTGSEAKSFNTKVQFMTWSGKSYFAKSLSLTKEPNPNMWQHWWGIAG